MKFLLTIVIACCFATVTQGQQTNNSKPPLVDAGKPAVFLTYLRLTEIKPENPARDTGNLFFSLTNNSKWPIWIDMSGVSKKEYGDVRLWYAIEDNKTAEVRIGSTKCHVCSVDSLKPGGSVVFSIPLRYASRDTRMRIEYSFEWEKESSALNGSYSEHSVVYYFSNLKSLDLPATLLIN